MQKRVGWTEGEVLALPTEESDVFERKAGKLLETRKEFDKALAKQLSAFANSGGGSIILGVADDGRTVDGVPALEGRTRIRDWIEQVIPSLLDSPLSDFRVHTVRRSDENSQIPVGREVIVIEVGDSAAAPHQSAKEHIYYHRQAGRSVPARHFYVDLIAKRRTAAALEWSLTGTGHRQISPYGNGLYFIISVQFAVHNVGHVAAREWKFLLRRIEVPEGLVEALPGDYFKMNGFPISYHPLPSSPSTILPDEIVQTELVLGFPLVPAHRTVSAVNEEIERLFEHTFFDLRLTNETSPGEVRSVNLVKKMRAADFGRLALTSAPEWFERRSW